MAVSAADISETHASADQLYTDKDWFGLDALPKDSIRPLHRAAVATAFLRSDAERLLREIISKRPNSEDAREAHRWLTHFLLNTGQYQKLATNVEDHLRAFPRDTGALKDRSALAPLLEMPDQITANVGAASVQHDGGLFIPLQINGVEAHFFIDTGAGFSALSQSEAARLKLRLAKPQGKVATSTTQAASYRVAVAKEVVIGGCRFHDVTFAVFPDDGEPWRSLPAGRRGLIGFPVQVALRQIRWSRHGTFAFGRSAGQAKSGTAANLALFDDHPGVKVSIDGRDVLFSMDSGAINTDIYSKFGEQFPALVGAKKSSTELRGVGGVEILESMELPDLKLFIGERAVVLQHAKMLTRPINSPKFVGNLGFDLLQQHGTFFIDFAAMRLELGSD
jgi:hypothetical protein